MTTLDWIVLFGTLGFIVAYGTWKTRGSQDMQGYFLGDSRIKWWTIGLSVMATQASAITFLSTPGQAYEDGMRFVQFYFGLPVAMILVSIFFLPIYNRLKVYTAYEYLENRFDWKTRMFTAFLFLLQRGLAAGLTIYAPAIIVSSILGWPLTFTNALIGVLVIIYTVTGGTKAVSQTQKHQMVVIMTGMFIALGVLLWSLPQEVSVGNAVQLAGKMGKLNVVNFEMDFSDRYNFWSGLTGGLFLALSYFGTDQSQVGRYLSGRSLKESRLGLIFNGLLKVPMQFVILFIGAMVFVFYQFYQPPVFFNDAAKQEVYESKHAGEMKQLEAQHEQVFEAKRQQVLNLSEALENGNEQAIQKYRNKVALHKAQQDTLHQQAVALVKKANPDAETEDTDYVFITFVMNYLPKGLVGLLFAVIFSAAMSSTSSELNALASTSCVDMYQRNFKKQASDRHYLMASKYLTVFWGILAILFATFASLLENLIEAINILGSVFYGTILGIFLVGFLLRFVKGTAVFLAALIGEAVVLYCYFGTDIGFLWYNVIGCGAVMLVAVLLQAMIHMRRT